MRKVSCKAKPRDRGKLPLVILEKKVGPFIYSSGANIFYLNLVQVKIVRMKFLFVRWPNGPKPKAYNSNSVTQNTHIIQSERHVETVQNNLLYFYFTCDL